MSKHEKQKGSLTLEMSLILPLFLFLFLTIYGLFSQVLCQNEMTHVLVQTTKSLAMDPYLNSRTEPLRTKGVDFWKELSAENIFIGLVRLDSNKYFCSKEDWHEGASVPEQIVRDRMVGFLGGGDEGKANKKLKSLGVEGGVKGIEITSTVANNNVSVKISYTRKFLFDFWGMGTAKASHEATSRLWVVNEEGAAEDINSDSSGGKNYPTGGGNAPGRSGGGFR